MRHLIHISLALTALLTLSGWSWDEKPRAFGDAYRMQLNAQKVNPEPKIAPDAPVEGLNGRRAASAMESYRNPSAQEKDSIINLKIPTLMDTEK